MGGMFPSSGQAVVTALWPVQLTTPAVLGGVLAVSAQFTPANVGFYIIDGAGTAVDAGTCDALPTGVALTGTTSKHAVLTFDSSYLSGKAQGAFALELSATDCLPQLATFQWGGTVDLLTQVPAQNILPMLNNGQPVRQTDTPTFVFLPFVDPATGLPDTSTPTMMVLPPGGFGESLTVMGTGPWFNNSSPTFTTAGRYFVMLQATINGVLFSAYGYVDWGDPGCVAISTNTLADTAAAQATLARKVLANKTTPNSSVTPTSLTVYDDDGVTTLGTRTIANADASAVSPTQVLDLGPIV